MMDSAFIRGVNQRSAAGPSAILPPENANSTSHSTEETSIVAVLYSCSICRGELHKPSSIR